MAELARISLVDPPPSAVSELRENLGASNQARSDIAEGLDLAVFVYDESGRLIGGVTGSLWGAALEMDFLPVRAGLRGHGLGRQILERLEKDARQRGGRVAFLDTYTFQAPQFYRQQRYQAMDVIEGYLEGIQKAIPKKSLV